MQWYAECQDRSQPSCTVDLLGDGEQNSIALESVQHPTAIHTRECLGLKGGAVALTVTDEAEDTN
jgi:hypothetical protein